MQLTVNYLFLAAFRLPIDCQPLAEQFFFIKNIL